MSFPPLPDPASGLAGWGGKKLLNLPPTAAEREAAKALGKPAEAADRESAIAAIEVGTEQLVERLQMVVDGALLGAMQVQDVTAEVKEILASNAKRLELEELAISLVVLALFHVPVLAEGASVADALTEGTQGVLRSLLSSQRVFAALPKSELGAELWQIAVDQKSVDSFMEIVEQNVRNPVEFSAERAALYSKAVTGAIGWTVAKVGEGSAKLTESAIKAMRQEDAAASLGSTGGGDTVRVGILGAAQSYVADHRFLARAQTRMLAAFVRSAPLTRGQVQQIARLFASKPLPADPHVLRTSYKLYFEALIWAKLYFGGQSLRAAEMPRSFTSLFSTGQGVPSITGVPNALVAYWQRRFGDLRQVAKHRTYSTAYSGLDQASALVIYFESLNRALASAAQDAGINLDRVFRVISPTAG